MRLSSSLAVVCALCLASWTDASPVECDDAGTAGQREWLPRTPEQTLYAYVRCLNDSSASVEMKVRWVMWQPDHTPESQCYVRCVTEELRLFDPATRQFQPERFVQQAQAFFDDNGDQALEQFNADARELLKGTLDNNECDTVYNKYAPFYNQHLHHILHIFHGDQRKIPATYQKLGDGVKTIGQYFIDFCERRHQATWAEEQTKDCPNSALVDCIFRGYRWVTEEGRVNIEEIKRDYHGAVGCDKHTDCQSAETASQLFRCLRVHDQEKIQQVIADRNQRTAFYFDFSSQVEPWKSAIDFGKTLLTGTA